MKEPLTPTAARVREAYLSGIHDYHQLMWAVFPPDDHPKLYRYSHNGGPPAAAMHLMRAMTAAGLMRIENKIFSRAKRRTETP